LIVCLHDLDSIDYKDPAHKSQFLERFVKYIPRVPSVSYSACTAASHVYSSHVSGKHALRWPFGSGTVRTVYF